MPMKSADLYRASQFAERAGVSVRTLHHYDRLGLLKPSGHTEAGYRLYAESDLTRLEEIVALKFIGFPLKKIRELLNRKPMDLPAALRLQRKIIEEKRRRLNLVMRAIEHAERVVQPGTAAASARSGRTSRSGEDGAWEALRKIIEVIHMQQDWEFINKYYTDEQLADLRTRWNPELQAKAEADWRSLILDVEAAVAASENPASAKAQELATRWQGLIGAFTGGNPGIAQGLKNLYADKSNWPEGVQKPYSAEVGAFICKAVEIRGRQ
jgi:MerR family transcriptional regulator, thiopeptide resistance regulator